MGFFYYHMLNVHSVWEKSHFMEQVLVNITSWKTIFFAVHFCSFLLLPTNQATLDNFKICCNFLKVKPCQFCNKVVPHKQNNHCYLVRLWHKTIKTDIHFGKGLGNLHLNKLQTLCQFIIKIRYTFQHYQHGPRRLIEERNELGEGPLKKMQRLSLHTAGQLNVLRISVHRTSLMCDKLELVSTALLPRRGGRRNRNLLMPKVS